LLLQAQVLCCIFRWPKLNPSSEGAAQWPLPFVHFIYLITNRKIVTKTFNYFLESLAGFDNYQLSALFFEAG
jgi:hypothetical protein